MKTYIQYFNCEKMGRFPNGADALLTQRMGVFTKLPSVKEAKGGTVLVITGLGKPKRYYLWEAFTIDDVQFDGTQYTVSGPGWVLLPPQVLEGKEFDKFKAACANFVSFRAIDDLPYKDTLRRLADQHHLSAVNPACEDFCSELIKALPKNGDAFYYRGTVRQRLGKTDAAREDFTKAVQLGTNFPQEAAAAMETPAPPLTPPSPPTSGGEGRVRGTTPGGKEQVAAQVVAKGLFAQQSGKKPAGVPDVTWRAILQRRGQEDLRQKLLQAYGGRCAITNHSGEPALEAAFLVGDAASGPVEVTNSVLLRADVRTLFDLNLIRIHPKTGVIFVADELKRTNYGRLHARRLRMPEKKEDRPSREALQQRWDAAESAAKK